MIRRQLVVLVSAFAMFCIGVMIVGSLVAATQSEGGREWIRRQVVREAGRGVKGKLQLGRLSGSFLTDIAIDSVQITDPDDSVFIATGPMHFTYDPRDLLDGRIIVRSAEVQRPFVVIRKGIDERWNFRKVFPDNGNDVPSPLPTRGTFGSLVVFQNVRLLGGNFQLSLPWQPDDSLKGARRDSSIAVNLAQPANEIRRVVSGGRRGFLRTWRWTEGTATLNRIRFRHPDSTGRQFDIARFDVVEHVPPFRFRNMRGGFLWRGDTIQLDMPHFELPGSTGKAKGRVVWGDDRPIRYDIEVHSDSVSLSDVAWIYAGLPRTGGGSMDLRIHNEPDLRILDYAITNMDVRSTRSRLRGSMTYGVGGPLLIVKDVDLELLPVDFALLETLNRKQFPYPWNGTITGTVRARGGPVDHFAVDDAKVAFADANVPGSTASGSGRGEIDIVSPGDVKFHGFRIDVAHFDLRTPQFVNADFPRVNGVVAGTATLDSIWSDVRFRDGDLTHADGDGTPVSRFQGSGRITMADPHVSFELAVAALPFSLTTLSRSYPAMPFRGDYSGPLRVRGSVADLSIVADMSGEAGRVQVDGQFDASLPGYRAVARGSVERLDLRTALGRPAAPQSSLNGRFNAELSGDSLSNLLGSARLVVDRSLIDSVRLYSAQAELRFSSGTMHVDSLRVESTVGLLTASGSFGLSSVRADTLRWRAVVDSLGGLRRYLAQPRRRPDASAAAGDGGSVSADSLEGSVNAEGTLAGNLTRFGVQALAEGSALRIGETTARRLASSLHVDALPDSATGTVAVRLDTLLAGGLALSRVAANADLLGGGRLTARVEAESPRGVRARSSVEVNRRGDTTDVRLDSLAVRTAGNSWSLAGPAMVKVAQGGFVVDTLVLAGGQGGRLALTGSVPAVAPMAFGLRADSVSLADLGEISQSPASMAGAITFNADVRGTRDSPEFLFSGVLRQARLGGLRLDQARAGGSYANQRLSTSFDYDLKGVPALHVEATLPLDLALRPRGSRFLEQPLSGRVRSDSAGLELLESLSGSVSGASGGLSIDVAMAGTWKHPRLTGALKVRDGALSLGSFGAVKWRGVDADLAFLGDSVVVRSLAARSGAQGAGSLRVTGWVAVRDMENPTFDLRLDARGFNLVNRPRLADLDFTGEMRLLGAYRAAALTGSLTVDRGVVYLPELYQKRVISLDDPEFYRVVDTSAFVERRILPQAPSTFVENLAVQDVPVQMGPDVWLRSEEANINLGGQVNITRRRAQSGTGSGNVQLALDGPLQTVRGTYRLNLGPVQRAFEVEGGEVRFYGDPDLSATVNITAMHTVRQVSQDGARPDVRVRVHIGGTLASPTAELSSPDSLRVTNADLISYLVTGGPSYEIGSRSTSTAARLLLSSFGSVIGGKASGSLCDDAQLSTAGLDAYQGRIRDVGGSILARTRFNCAKQLGEKVFVRLDAGLCQVGQLLGGANTSDPLSFADAIGVKLDYRVSSRVMASVGVEPPTSAVLCSRDASARGFAPTPRQFGVDLFRIWRF